MLGTQHCDPVTPILMCDIKMDKKLLRYATENGKKTGTVKKHAVKLNYSSQESRRKLPNSRVCTQTET